MIQNQPLHIPLKYTNYSQYTYKYRYIAKELDKKKKRLDPFTKNERLKKIHFTLMKNQPYSDQLIYDRQV